jgi:hypothetical protein
MFPHLSCAQKDRKPADKDRCNWIATQLGIKFDPVLDPHRTAAGCFIKTNDGNMEAVIGYKTTLNPMQQYNDPHTLSVCWNPFEFKAQTHVEYAH